VATPTKFRESFITKHRWRILTGLLVTIAVIWFVVALLPRLLVGRPAVEDSWAGDNYSMVNSLFAALAFGGVIFTILLQSEELRLQRLELEETQESLARTAAAQERSEQMLFVAAYLNACNSVLDGFRSDINDDALGEGVTPWDAASFNLVTQVSAIRDRLSKQRFAELIAISPAETYRARIRHIRDYLAGRIELCPSDAQHDRLQYIRRTAHVVNRAVEATVHFMGAFEE